MMAKIVEEKLDLPDKLLISGVNGQAAGQLQRQIKEMHLEGHIILTGFIRNEERNTLYRECHTFLFPSVFEGFGMPTIEAMLFGTQVVTTKCSSIPEITQGKAVYVEDPYDIEEWIEKIQTGKTDFTVDYDRYAPQKIAGEYLAYLKESVWKKK